jgi:hypothetical protein
MMIEPTIKLSPKRESRSLTLKEKFMCLKNKSLFLLDQFP